MPSKKIKSRTPKRKIRNSKKIKSRTPKRKIRNSKKIKSRTPKRKIRNSKKVVKKINPYTQLLYTYKNKKKYEERKDDDPNEMYGDSFTPYGMSHWWKYTLVYFYAPLCRFCKEFSPIFEQLKQYYGEQTGSDTYVHIAKIDAYKYKNVFKSQNIKSFPTIKLYINNGTGSISYNGPRTSQDIIKFIEDKKKLYGNY